MNKIIKIFFTFVPEVDQEIKNFDDKVVARVYRQTVETSEQSDTTAEGEKPIMVTTKHETTTSVSYNPEVPVEEQEIANLLRTTRETNEVFLNEKSIGFGTVAE